MIPQIALLLASILLFLPSCYHISTQREFTQVSTGSKFRTGHDLIIKGSSNLVDEQVVLETEAHIGLSREEAVKKALHNNPGLQANLQNVAIAKADLVQAGLLTNPNFNGVRALLPDIDLPLGAEAENSFATTGSFTLSDLWMKPFETAVACNELKSVFAEVEQSILQTKRDVNIFYNRILDNILRIQVADMFVEQLEDLYAGLEQIKGKRALQLDYSVTGIIIGNEINRRDVTKADLNIRYADLRKAIGMFVNYEEVALTEKLFSKKAVLPDLHALLAGVIDTHPRVLAEEYKVEAAKKFLTLQKASIFREVELGFITDSPGGSVTAFGPLISLELPLFDANQAQIARARFILDQAEKGFLEVRREVIAGIIDAYFELKGRLIRQKNFEAIIRPAFEKGIDFILDNSESYAGDKDLSLVVLIQSLQGFYLTKIEYIELQRDTLNAFAELELAAGRSLYEFNGGLTLYERKADEYFKNQPIGPDVDVKEKVARRKALKNKNSKTKKEE